MCPRYLRLSPRQRKADRRSQKLLSNLSFIAALLKESKAELLHGYQTLKRRPALPIGVFLVLGPQEAFRIELEDSHWRSTCTRHQTRRPLVLAARSNTYAFTVSNASAAFVNRRDANAASIPRKNSSRSSSVVNSIATPRSLSGASVGVTRNSPTLNPRSPGNVVHPS